jgi:hypothetical protein
VRGQSGANGHRVSLSCGSTQLPARRRSRRLHDRGRRTRSATHMICGGEPAKKEDGGWGYQILPFLEQQNRRKNPGDEAVEETLRGTLPSSARRAVRRHPSTRTSGKFAVLTLTSRSGNRKDSNSSKVSRVRFDTGQRSGEIFHPVH